MHFFRVVVIRNAFIRCQLLFLLDQSFEDPSPPLFCQNLLIFLNFSQLPLFGYPGLFLGSPLLFLFLSPGLLDLSEPLLFCSLLLFDPLVLSLNCFQHFLFHFHLNSGLDGFLLYLSIKVQLLKGGTLYHIADVSNSLVSDYSFVYLGHFLGH